MVLKKDKFWAEEMAQWWRLFAVLKEIYVWFQSPLRPSSAYLEF